MKTTRTTRLAVIAALATLLPLLAPTQPAHGDGDKDAILILDASGSMWGQIDGVNKIVIAKDVVEELVRALPEQQRLGLVAYGHRREGDCNDIETIAAVGAQRKTVIDAIRTLSPKGKTPLSASVEHAANTLDYKKHAATVILVSDGLETCSADPCALARTLEQNGLDFTVHVIGFDVTVEERKGLQCIAEETGGAFFAADNADELSAALAEVALAADEVAPPSPDRPAAVAAEPVPATLAMKATILSGGPQVMSKLAWTVTPAAGGDPVFSIENTGAANTSLVPGDYLVKAVWTGWRDGAPKVGEMTISIKAQQPKVITVPIDLALPVTLEAPEEIAEGQTISVVWSGPDQLGATININRLDDAPLKRMYFFDAAKARSADGTAADTDGDGDVDQDDLATAALAAPTQPGDYEIRYLLKDPATILKRRNIRVTDSLYTVSAPDTAPVSTEIEIAWEGPLTKGDLITLVPKGDERAFDNGNYRAIEEGENTRLTTPKEAGEYEIRYVMAGGYTTYEGMMHSVQTSVPITVTDVSAAVSGPPSAVGGSTIEVTWRGPADGWDNDFLSVVEPGAAKFNRESMAKIAARGRAEAVNPAPIRVPAIAGDYELVYVMDPGQRIIARTPITIVRAQASVDAPDTVKAGSGFTVKYSGDGFAGDRVVIAPVDAPDSKMWGYTVRYGFPAKPGESEGSVTAYPIAAGPGAYEARYVTGLQHQVIARDRFTVVE